MGTLLHPDDPYVLPEPSAGAGPLSVRIAGGDGPPVLLIHGLGRVAATWADVARLTDGRLRLVLMDNPGIGRSSALPVPRTIEAHAELYEQTLSGLAIREPVHVAGLSLGGMIAAALCARLGDRAASLLMLSSSSRETGFWRLSPSALLRMAGRAVRYLAFDHRVNMPELARPEVIAEHRSLSASLDALQSAEGFSARTGMLQLLAAARFRIEPHLQGLPSNRLVAVGETDRLVSPEHSRRLARLLDCPLEVLPGRRHDLGLDAPAAVAGLLLRMAGLPARASAGRPSSAH